MNDNFCSVKEVAIGRVEEEKRREGKEKRRKRYVNTNKSIYQRGGGSFDNRATV